MRNSNSSITILIVKLEIYQQIQITQLSQDNKYYLFKNICNLKLFYFPLLQLNYILFI